MARLAGDGARVRAVRPLLLPFLNLMWWGGGGEYASGGGESMKKVARARAGTGDNGGGHAHGLRRGRWRGWNEAEMAVAVTRRRGGGWEAHPENGAHAERPLPELLTLWLLVAVVILALVPRVIVPADSNTGDNTGGAALV